ncbi:acyl-phosphate glycerol 3-phosphate acyltransferase [Gordoniibacillus kamchatkensis]|uniref:1-acyl-sn-glycerol-3-phosphate acyltransferase n=1 Tax=Gordoniibacillus kamchatkensis TaxID=1590651 RepID=A0ABR5AKP2_9BACL|nr:lysophospholipid acyltransferase family protein [Paenibacillus sp. VKM B-2647]KIL41526.1 acyl-phosphate glycerol 3-phosphate acyltransferase [Paenibacillus sp. VKM B-2647]
MWFYRFGQFVCDTVFSLVFRLRTVGVDNIPKSGPVMLCSNHISNLDPPLIGTRVPRKLHFMAKAELFDIPLFASLIRVLGAFPVKRGGVSKESIRTAIQLLKDGNVICIFPEGTRNNLEAVGKRGAAAIALKAGAVVIPVAIVGTYRPFRRMTIVYGKPLDLSDFDGSTSEQTELATERIMNAIRTLLAEGPDKAK